MSDAPHRESTGRKERLLDDSIVSVTGSKAIKYDPPDAFFAAGTESSHRFMEAAASSAVRISPL